MYFFFFSSRRRHTRYIGDWSSDVCSSDLTLGRRGKRGQRCLLHGHSARKRERSRAVCFEKERVGECQGGELNSRPTPKAFGAALPLQIMNREFWVLLAFQQPFDLSCITKSRHFFPRNNLQRGAETFSCCSMTAAN